VYKDLLALFNQASAIDLTDKKLNTKEHLYTQINGEYAASIHRKYTSLTYHDQYHIQAQLLDHVHSMYTSFPRTQTLPNINHILFLFDLMEYNMNILTLLLFAIRMLKVLPHVDKQLNDANQSNRIFLGQYVNLMYFNLIGCIRLHLSCLTVWQDLTVQLFRLLYAIVKHIETPRKCNAHEKTVLVLMNDMYATCAYLKSRFPKYRELYERTEKAKLQNVKDPPNTECRNLIGPFQTKADETLSKMIMHTE
jgi:hypothetical protein